MASPSIFERKEAAPRLVDCGECVDWVTSYNSGQRLVSMVAHLTEWSIGSIPGISRTW